MRRSPNRTQQLHKLGRVALYPCEGRLDRSIVYVPALEIDKPTFMVL